MCVLGKSSSFLFSSGFRWQFGGDFEVGYVEGVVKGVGVEIVILKFFGLFCGWVGDDLFLLAEGTFLGLLLLFEFGGCSFDAIIFGKDILRHGDSKLIIFIFMQGVIFKILDILDLEHIFLL